jgi:cardiolipin synthase
MLYKRRCHKTDPLSPFFRKPSTNAKKPLLKVLTQLTPHENIYTIPNILTFSRLIAAPVIGYLVLHDYHAWAVGLFGYAAITDLVDGYIARRWNLQTVVGTVIDPMADKTLMTVLTVCLAVKGALPGRNPPNIYLKSILFTK